MADKEPRRRKKRRDSQKKESEKNRKRLSFENDLQDDVRSEDHFFSSLKSESRDSDQDTEDEPISHSHHSQPSTIAKFVFMLLFSGLVLSLSFIFISLRDAEKGPVDIFDGGHGDHHGEIVHDEHLEEALHEDHDHHEENEALLDEYIPGLSSIFSLNNEQIKEVESQEIPSEEEDKDDEPEDDEENYDVHPDIQPETSTDQGMLEEYVEDIPPVTIEKPLSSEVYPETTTESSFSDEAYSTLDYSDVEDYVTPSIQDENELTPEPFSYDEPEDIPTTVSPNALDDDNVDELDKEDRFSIYERADITNEADYEIREQLDQLEDIVKKDSKSNDNSDEIDDNENDDNHHDGDDDDDDEEEDDEGVEEEFDFWQF